MSKEDFVSFEQAQKLKALGFDIPTYGCYDARNRKLYEEVFERHWSEYDNYVSCPTLAVACKWLRSKGWAVQTCLIGTRTAYFARVWKLEMNSDVVDVAGQYETYEQAQSAGIDVALGLLERERTE